MKQFLTCFGMNYIDTRHLVSLMRRFIFQHPVARFLGMINVIALIFPIAYSQIENNGFVGGSCDGDAG